MDQGPQQDRDAQEAPWPPEVSKSLTGPVKWRQICTSPGVRMQFNGEIANAFDQVPSPSFAAVAKRARTGCDFEETQCDNPPPSTDDPREQSSLDPSLYPLRDKFVECLAATPVSGRDLASLVALGLLNFASYAKGYSNYQPLERSSSCSYSSMRAPFLASRCDTSLSPAEDNIRRIWKHRWPSAYGSD
ncbi:hypothetical protein N7468_004251 [Penicillium chermesinum]|uniref:Uncharacterized protein n=1 Tax=Penicillium chermesinum TaxID=63820 RepID=A0A9W9TSK3_9EURO|nr:uncharacterized protein N7468_004251 [Penicillium chermesinum]KAJ5239632.1 hypothetical protein N7468_004251 [Penicillium chermesinum]